MSLVEKILFLGGFVVIWGYPLVLMLIGMQWFLLVVDALSTAAFFMTIKMFLCTQCMNFACPLNEVDDNVRQASFEQNPQIAKAWGRE